MNSETGQVRSFVEADRPEVIGIWQITFADDPPWNEPNLVIDTKLRIQPELFLVFDQADQVIGTVVAGFDGFRGWLHHVAVHPDHQGKGIATLMITAAEQRLIQLGCQKVNLQVRLGNTVAADRYAKMGYKPEDRISMGKRLLQKPDPVE